MAVKTADWLAAGTRFVWIVDPATRSLAAHAADGMITPCTAFETAPAGHVMPGFSLALARVFG